MLDFHQKRKLRGVLYHRVTLVVLGILVLILIHSTWTVYKKKEESEQLKIIAQNRVDELNDRDTDLKSKIDKLATPSGIEEEIRSKFSVAKENENVVVIVPDEAKEATTTVKTESFWQKILNFWK